MKKLNIKQYKINHIFEKIKKCKGTIKINSKEINKGDIFISLKGSKDHGEKYINDAIEKGAKLIITEKSIRINHFYLNSLSVGFSHQIGKSFNGKIMVNNIGYDINEINDNGLLSYFQNIPIFDNGNEYNSVQEYLDLNNSIDALDKNNIFIENLEVYLYPDIYAEYDDNNFIENGKSIKDLKERYNAYKQSIGIEMKLLGFSFYSYPTALTYEYYFPISDSWNTLRRQYLRILFDFN